MAVLGDPRVKRPRRACRAELPQPRLACGIRLFHRPQDFDGQVPGIAGGEPRQIAAPVDPVAPLRADRLDRPDLGVLRGRAQQLQIGHG